MKLQDVLDRHGLMLDREAMELLDEDTGEFIAKGLEEQEIIEYTHHYFTG